MLAKFLLCSFTVLLCALILPEGEAQDIANTTIKEQVGTETSPFGFFSSFIVEEVSRFPRASWPRGEGWSRRSVARVARAEMAKGSMVVLFSASFCPLCDSVFEIFEELGVPATRFDYETQGNVAAGGRGKGRTLGEVLKEELFSLDVSNVEPFVFLGTR